MSKQSDLNAYEERYRRVFTAGGLYWNDPNPNPFLLEIAETLPEGSQCVEFGCGEGYQSRLMATCGHSVLGIDLSPTAIKRAWQNTPEGMNVRYEIGDVTDPNDIQLKENYYDLAVDIRCLHMMADLTDRDSYLKNVWESLKTKGILYLQNGLDLSDVCPQSTEEEAQIEQLKQLRVKPAGYQLSSLIHTRTVEKQIKIPMCPLGKLQRLEEYVNELKIKGFGILKTKRINSLSNPYEAVIIAEKNQA
jgi:SAM-dependent methyltransferase